MSYGMQPITYGYVEGGYIDEGYLVETEGIAIEFRHDTAGTISFAKGIMYPDYSLDIWQASETTVCNVPVYYTPLHSQISFQATFADITDAELSALRTFMFSGLPIFDTFTFAEVKRDKYTTVRFSDLKLSVQMLLPNHNRASVNLVRV